MAWFQLLLAGALEIVWALGLRTTDGFTRPVPTLITVGAIAASMALLAQAARTLPIGTAYAIWVGIGATGAAIGGALLFDESMPPLRVTFLVLLVVSVVGLKLTAAAP